MLQENIIDVTERDTRDSSNQFETSKRFVPVSKVHIKYPKGLSEADGFYEKTVNLSGHFVYDQNSSIQQNVGALLRHTYVIKSPKEINPNLWILSTQAESSEHFDLEKSQELYLVKKEFDKNLKAFQMRINEFVKFNIFDNPKPQPRPVPIKSKSKKIQKGSKNKSVRKQIRLEDLTKFTSCGRFAINSTDGTSFADTKAMKFLDSIKFEVFKTQGDFQKQVINKLNHSFVKQQFDMTYVSHETQKYMTIKCAACKRFSVWFKNTDGKDVESVDYHEANLQFFRTVC